jgi:cytochrome c oxidase subunit 2
MRWSLLVGLIGCGGSEEPDRVAEILALDGDAIAGADVYDAECAACHGLNGEGGVGPPLASVARLAPEDIVRSVIEGVGSGMPAFDRLPDQDVADVLVYITESF